MRQPPLFFLEPIKRLYRSFTGGGIVLKSPIVSRRPSETGARSRVSDEAIEAAANGGVAAVHRAIPELSPDRGVEDSDVAAERRTVEKAFAMRKLQERAAAERGTRAVGVAPSPIETIGLRKVYRGGKVAVKDLTLSIHEDECFGLLGPNGAGKTSTIAMLTGLYPPSSGEASICGFDQSQMHRIHEAMGVCACHRISSRALDSHTSRHPRFNEGCSPLIVAGSNPVPHRPAV